MRIEDSVPFVTGANRGLGLAFAKELLGRGVKKVYAGVRNPKGVELPGVIPVKLDVTDSRPIEAAALCQVRSRGLRNMPIRSGRLATLARSSAFTLLQARRTSCAVA